MLDTVVNSEGVEVAKFKKSKEGLYTWRLWAVYPAKHISDHKLSGKRGYYAENTVKGLYFTGGNLAYMREQLFIFDEVLKESERKGVDLVPKGCYKTADRVKVERASRTTDEKLASADKQVVTLLESTLRKGEGVKEKFLADVKVNLHYAIAWSYDAILYSFLQRLCGHLLSAPAMQRHRTIVAARRSYAEAMLRLQYVGNSSGALHRAVDQIEGEAVKRFVEICDACINVYKREGVEVEDYYV